MDQEKENLKERISELKEFIEGIEKDFSSSADDIIDKVCKRAIKRMNKVSDGITIVTDDFPPNFTFFDRLSVFYQTRTMDEMGYPDDMLEDLIMDTIDVVIDSLPEIEQLILNYSDCQDILYGDDYYEAPNKKALKHFYKLLNEHSNLVKIQKFTENSGYF